MPESTTPEAELALAESEAAEAEAHRRSLEDRLLEGDVTVTASELLEADNAVKTTQHAAEHARGIFARKREVARRKQASDLLKAEIGTASATFVEGLETVGDAQSALIGSLASFISTTIETNAAWNTQRAELVKDALGAEVLEQNHRGAPTPGARSVAGVSGQDILETTSVLQPLSLTAMLAEAIHLAGLEAGLNDGLGVPDTYGESLKNLPSQPDMNGCLSGARSRKLPQAVRAASKSKAV